MYPYIYFGPICNATVTTESSSAPPQGKIVRVRVHVTGTRADGDAGGTGIVRTLFVFRVLVLLWAAWRGRKVLLKMGARN